MDLETTFVRHQESRSRLQAVRFHISRRHPHGERRENQLFMYQIRMNMYANEAEVDQSAGTGATRHGQMSKQEIISPCTSKGI